MKYKELQQYYESCQTAADELAFTLIKERELNSKMNVFQNYCNFNVHQTIGQCRFYLDAVDFVNKNGDELKRKFELNEFMEFAQELRTKRYIFKIETFEQFKNIVIERNKIKTKK